jgi:anti-sigma factor RsiW
MMRPENISEAMLHGFVDGRLPAGERQVVVQWLESDPEAAAEIAVWQRQRDAIATLYAPVATEPVPARLDPRRLAAARTGRRNSFIRMAAAAVVLVGIGIGAGWLAHDRLTPGASDLLIANAVNAHALYVKENRHAVEVAASDEKHLVTWLSNRLSRQISAPDLSSQGFTLVGGRLLPPALDVPAGPVAQLMYENATADRLTVYVTAALPGGKRTASFEKVDGLDAFYWANDTITCTVVADLPKDQMQPVARAVYQQLTWR